MYRYISLVWDAYNPQKTEIAHFISNQLRSGNDWNRIFERPGLLVFHAGERPGRMQSYLLGNDGGVILGKLFEQPLDNRASPSVTYLDKNNSRQIIETQGRHLIENYWGRYVAFVNCDITDRLYILRDPTGGFPCYFTNYKGVDIYFSYMEDLVQLNLLDFSVNWNYIAAYMKFFYMQKCETGLNEVSELLSGECLEVTPTSKSKTFYWNPGKIAQSSVIETLDEAARTLRQTGINCITAWASCYSNILHRLSGGLDSSIVLGCLRHITTPVNITCLNYFTEEMDGDERIFARMSAEHAGVRLIERKEKSSNMKFERMLNMHKSAVPEVYINGIDRGNFDISLAKKLGADAVFSGLGGDNLFFQSQTSLSATDYAIRHGFSPHFFIIAMEAARLHRISVWPILYMALRNRIQKYLWNPYADQNDHMNTSLMNPEILTSLKPEDNLHPWIKMANDLPPGKLQHLFALTVPPMYYEAVERSIGHLEPVHPILSQPLIELCLRVPTYVLTAGGRDRGLARLAFAYDIPAKIIRRESKGSVNNHLDRAFVNNIEFIREHLLDGILVREKFLNHDNLEKALSKNCIDVDAERLKILCHLSTEIWLRSWVK